MYGYILYQASNLIAGGSEMLELVMSPGLIGGLVLPVMGAGRMTWQLAGLLAFTVPSFCST